MWPQRSAGQAECFAGVPAARRRSFNLVVPASPDSGAEPRGSPHGAGATGPGGCQKGTLRSPAAQHGRAPPELPGTPFPGSSLGPSGPAPPESIPFTVEAITFTSQGITYRTERITLTARRVSTVQTTPPPEPVELDHAERSLAAKVFELLTALDPDSRLRKAPPIKVFLLRYRQNRSLSEIARICDCGKSLVALRLKTFQEKLPWQPQQLQELSAHIEAMQGALSDSRARRIYRKGADYGEEEGGEGSG